jgi:hypothetical protein
MHFFATVQPADLLEQGATAYARATAEATA